MSISEQNSICPFNARLHKKSAQIFFENIFRKWQPKSEKLSHHHTFFLLRNEAIPVDMDALIPTSPSKKSENKVLNEISGSQIWALFLWSLPLIGHVEFCSEIDMKRWIEERRIFYPAKLLFYILYYVIYSRHKDMLLFYKWKNYFLKLCPTKEISLKRCIQIRGTIYAREH